MKMKWYIYSNSLNLHGPFKTKKQAVLYVDYVETGIVKRISEGHYENQYGEIIATEKNMIAMGITGWKCE